MRRLFSSKLMMSICRTAPSSISISRTAGRMTCRAPKSRAQGKLAFNLQVDERSDGRGFPYYWLRFGERSGDFRAGTDIHALKQNKISVTPLKLDLTDYSVQDRVARALLVRSSGLSTHVWSRRKVLRRSCCGCGPKASPTSIC